MAPEAPAGALALALAALVAPALPRLWLGLAGASWDHSKRALATDIKNCFTQLVPRPIGQLIFRGSAMGHCRRFR
eukprot:2920028-Pyramimonas_sp.AAC.1